MNPRIAIVGAGCSGIASIKYLQEAGLTNLTCYEQNEDIGGNWLFDDKNRHSSICETTHIISSKELSIFPDFPMPDHYPDYPSHKQILEYFNSFVDAFDLKKFIQFNTKIESIEKQEDESWLIKESTGTTSTFDYLLLANGHHSVPRMPNLPGTFSGELLHAHDYKTNKSFANKKVLVIGGGNSACDCAVEISRVAANTMISMRRPHYIIPKFFMGIPTDVFNQRSLWVPKIIRNFLFKHILKFQIGKYEDYGLATPDFPITKDHPTLNSELLYKLRHGRVIPKPGIKSIQGQKISFTNGTSETFDSIIAATGYKIATPFFNVDFLDYTEADEIPLYKRVFHPDHPTLFFIGLVQPQGAIWPLSSLQSKLVAKLIQGEYQTPKNIHELAKKDAQAITKQFLKRKRHTIEVDHEYARDLTNILKT